jgi:hypothetical protein
MYVWAPADRVLQVAGHSPGEIIAFRTRKGQTAEKVCPGLVNNNETGTAWRVARFS